MSGTMPTDIIVGVDTHKHTHAAVAITGLGARVAELTIKGRAQAGHLPTAWVGLVLPLHFLVCAYLPT